MIFKQLIDELRIWFEAFLRNVPGRIGIYLRRTWYKVRFRNSSELIIATGCEFISPQTISLGESVVIGRNSFFSAEDGLIEVGDNTAFNMNVHI
ncbi:MAG: hypothetical protein PHP01_09490, partial [Phycisphaerae bacterium]|nr:hypothetical protein [Phycisphaerae bacterium]